MIASLQLFYVRVLKEDQSLKDIFCKQNPLCNLHSVITTLFSKRRRRRSVVNLSVATRLFEELDLSISNSILQLESNQVCDFVVQPKGLFSLRKISIEKEVQQKTLKNEFSLHELNLKETFSFAKTFKTFQLSKSNLKKISIEMNIMHMLQIKIFFFAR